MSYTVNILGKSSIAVVVVLIGVIILLNRHYSKKIEESEQARYEMQVKADSLQKEVASATFVNMKQEAIIQSLKKDADEYDTKINELNAKQDEKLNTLSKQFAVIDNADAEQIAGAILSSIQK